MVFRIKNRDFVLVSIALSLLFLFSELQAIDKDQKLVIDDHSIYTAHEIFVKIKATQGNEETGFQIHDLLKPFNITSVEPLFKRPVHSNTLKIKQDELNGIFKIKVPDDNDIKKICDQLNQNPGIEYAEPNTVLKVDAEPNDPDYPQQNHLPQMHLPEAWDVAKGDSSVIIAIIDAGVDWNHPDLADNIWRNPNEILDGIDNDNNGFVDDIRGWDFVQYDPEIMSQYQPALGEDASDPDNDPMDFGGHGTHVAGCAAAVTNNSLGVAGVSWNCTIMPLRVGYKPQYSSEIVFPDLIFKAFCYAADMGADIINLSSDAGSFNILVDAARYASERGLIICHSAGNENKDAPDLIDFESFVLTAAAVTETDMKSPISNFGSWVDVSAPGTGISSTIFDNNYGKKTGTSQSSALVAGLAGLLKSFNPRWSNADLMFRIVETADDIDQLNLNRAGKLGSGRVNAYRALTDSISPKPQISLVDYIVNDSEEGNDNGFADAGETIRIVIRLMNTWGDAKNVTAMLQINDWAVTVIDNVTIFPTIAGLTSYGNNQVQNDFDPFVIKIADTATPHMINLTLIISDKDSTHRQYNFSIPISPSILLVDDDDGEINIENYYTSKLDSLGFSYDYWDHSQQGPPDHLDDYATVIWACETVFPSIDQGDRQVMQAYLDNGGALFISGQDIGWDLNEMLSPPYSNEFLSSDGESKIFYESYLHAQYLNDDSDYSTLSGIAGDPISDSISFNVYQPDHNASMQWPSEVAAINNGIPLFVYPNGKAGAVRFAGDYRTVYFAFGGYEAIVQDYVRATVLPRILNWLNGVDIAVDSLPDTEDNMHDYKVRAHIKSERFPLSRVDLFWDVDGQLPFNKVAMNLEREGLYSALIPAQNNTKVTYTVLVRTERGFITISGLNSFKVGSDIIAPVIHNITGFSSSLYDKGPFLVQAVITDNAEVDTQSVYLHYGKVGNLADSLLLTPLGIENSFAIELPHRFYYGDSIYYYISASDVAQKPNMTQSEMDTVIIGSENFESGSKDWFITPNTFKLDSTDFYSGQHSIYFVLDNILLDTTEIILALKHGFDLSDAQSADLSFWNKYNFKQDDVFGIVEISSDSSKSWQPLRDPFRDSQDHWLKNSYSLNSVCGDEFQNVLLRFRVEIDQQSMNNQTYWRLDDIQVDEELPVEIAREKPETHIPETFILTQNYPNPFNPATMITIGIPQYTHIKLMVYNSLGQAVCTLINGYISGGYYRIRWDGKDFKGKNLPSGIYIYRLSDPAGSVTISRKMLLLR